MNRLTHKRVNGIKTGYWSPAKKEELVQRLAAYENTDLEPEEIVTCKDCAFSVFKQFQERWIPVTERLPDLWDERYLVSLAWGGVGVMEYKSTGFHNYGSFSPVPIETVNAWMPLPVPYRKEAEDE